MGRGKTVSVEANNPHEANSLRPRAWHCQTEVLAGWEFWGGSSILKKHWPAGIITYLGRGCECGIIRCLGNLRIEG